MKKIALSIIGLMGLAAAGPVSAAPFSAVGSAPAAESVVETVQGYRYHRRCVWLGDKWGYHHGGKVLVCRPHKPHGHGWVWHHQGKRHGWYQPHRKSWHYKKW